MPCIVCRLANEQEKSEMLKQIASHTSELRNRAERLKGRDAEAVTAAQQVRHSRVCSALGSRVQDAQAPTMHMDTLILPEWMRQILRH